MDRIYKYNPDAIYKPNGGICLQIMSASIPICFFVPPKGP